MSLSTALLESNSRFIPGGLVSLNRKVQPVIAFVRGKGSRLWDADGKEYIDYHAAFGPHLLGHGDEEVEEAVRLSMEKGWTLTGSGPTPWEGEAAELLCRLIPAVEKAIFVNTGSEATYAALRLARAATGRQHIIVMQGGYNGWHDYVACNVMTPLDQLGPRTTHGEYPFVGMSSGMAETVPSYVHVVEFNSLEAVDEVMSSYPVACVLTEPALQNIGVVRPKPGYLQGLKALCEKHGALLILDEVKTGFRAGLRGLHHQEGVMPDLLVFGKAIASGHPVGALGGRGDLMDWIAHPDPAKRVMVAGTYNGHPVPLAAAIATMKKLEREESVLYPRLEQLSDQLAKGMESLFDRAGVDCTVARLGSAMAPYFMTREPESWHDLAGWHDMNKDLAFRRALVEKGIYFLPLATKQISVSAAHTEDDIAQTLEAIAGALREGASGWLRSHGLLWRRPHLEDLPDVEIPSGYELRPIRPGEEASAGECLTSSFGDSWDEERVRQDLSENDFVKTMFVVVKDGEVAATASAASGSQWEGIGYVHFVGTKEGHLGKKLGYWATLACLHEFKKLGYPSAVLHTDDWRIPAIKTYLKLGFNLDQDAHPSFPSRWRRILNQLEPKP